MSSDRTGVHTSGALNRDKAENAIVDYDNNQYDHDGFLNALEACVVPDPRLARIEAELDRVGHISGYGPLRRRLEAILRGDE